MESLSSITASRWCVTGHDPTREQNVTGARAEGGDGSPTLQLPAWGITGGCHTYGRGSSRPPLGSAAPRDETRCRPWAGFPNPAPLAGPDTEARWAV